MDNSTSAGIKDYAGILQQMSALLNLSISETMNKYTDYPYCLIDHFEKVHIGKTIEIRFDKEEITATCIFGTEKKCECVYLFPDKNETIAGFISYLKETFNYDFIKNRWEVSGYYVAFKEISKSPYDLSLMIYG